MKAVVTGADGLLGSNLVRELLDQKFEVRALIEPGRKSVTLTGLAVEKVSADILGEVPALTEAMRGGDALFHCAAITNQWAAPALVWKVNHEGTKNVLEAMVAAKVPRAVFVGSASSVQFGTIERPGDETGAFPGAYRGVAYMESKYQASMMVKEYAKERGLQAVVAMPTFLLGPYDAGPSSGELLRQFIKRGLKTVSRGGRNFAHARDVARGMVAALTKGKSGSQYILGGENLTYLDFFSRVAKQAGVPPPKRTLPGPALVALGALGSAYGKISGKPPLINLAMARLATCGTYYSSDRAASELGYTRAPVDQSIADSLNSLYEYGHLDRGKRN